MELGERRRCADPPLRSPPLSPPVTGRGPPAHLLTRLSFPLADVASGCTLVLTLLLMGLSRTGAVPVPTPLPAARGCQMAQFKSLSPQELNTFRRARDALVSLPICCGLAPTLSPWVPSALTAGV